MRRLLIALIVLAGTSTAALAQACQVVQNGPQLTAGGSVFDRVASQWNAYFASKIDANNGTACNLTVQGTLNISLTAVVSALGYTPLNPARNLSDVANAATSLANLGGAATTAALLRANNLSDVANAATSLSNLGGASAATVLLKANNLSDVANALTAQNNLLNAANSTNGTSSVVTITTAGGTNAATVNWTANGLAAGTPICFTVAGGSLPPNVFACPQTYYVFTPGTNSFTIAGSTGATSFAQQAMPTSGSSSGTVTAFANPNQGSVVNLTVGGNNGSWISSILVPPTPSLGQQLYGPPYGSALLSNSDWIVRAANFFYTDQDPAMLGEITIGGTVTVGKTITVAFNFGTTGKCAITALGTSNACFVSYTPQGGDTLATVCTAIGTAMVENPDLFSGVPGHLGEITNVGGCVGAGLNVLAFDWNGATPLNINISQASGGTFTGTVNSNCQDGFSATFVNGSPVITAGATVNYAVNQPIVFADNGGDTLPTNFSKGVFYYVVAAGLGPTTFEVATSPGGTAIVAGSAGSGTHQYRQFCTPFLDAGPLWVWARQIPAAQYGGFVRPISGGNLGQLNVEGINSVGTGVVYGTLTFNVDDPVAGTSEIFLTTGGASGADGLIEVFGELGAVPDANMTSFFGRGSHTGSDNHNDFSLTTTINTSAAITPFGLQITDTAHGANSLAMQITGGAAGLTNLMKLDLAGNMTLGGSVSTALPSSFNGFVRTCVAGINANSANTDNVITLSLPTGVTQYRMGIITLSNPSISLTTATFGVFPSAGGAGTAIVASGTALSPLTAAPPANGSLFLPTIVNNNTVAYTANPIYLRIQTAQGAAATFDACVAYEPLGS